MQRLLPLFLLLAAACGASTSDGSKSPDATPAAPTGDTSTATTTATQDPPTATPASLPGLSAYAAGTNLSGLEFNSGTVPGRAYFDFGVPTHAEVDYFVGKGFGFFRIPFLWERIQPKLEGELDATYLGLVKDLATYASGKGAHVLLDVHNYARYHGKVIGSDGPTGKQFGDLWARLAKEFGSDPNMVFGIMNEPNGMDTKLWLDDANAAIAAIRAEGATNLLTVPGTYWTGAHAWTKTDNATVMLGVVDPLDHWIYESHQYLDSDSSGTHAECPSTTSGKDGLASFTEWLKTNHKKALLNEFGAANNPTCLASLEGMLAYMDANRDAWGGYTYWSAGPWWGDYMYSIEPTKTGADAPQLATLLRHL